jgi:hypothetical protein
MRFLWCLALCLALFSCAAQKASVPTQDCARDSSGARGSRDGKAGRLPDLSFLQYCATAEARGQALQAYREAFEAARPKRAKDHHEESLALPIGSLPPVGREPATPHNWVCEVEANSKVFTGSGPSKEEALGLARSTCVSHFQASNCADSECKQNL